MARKILPFLILFASTNAFAQFKNDNVLYKNVDPSELCNSLDKNKGYLLLDVRSSGEHHDTSTFAGYNLGHLKGAKNIDIRELGNRIAEIRAFKDQPVFIYCSHSQRSRRASKMLSDSGFTKIFNINGGMSAIHYNNLKQDECMQSLVQTGNNYAIISAEEICKKVNSKAGEPFLLDVRSDSAWRRISLDANINAFGSLKGSQNIPLSELPAKLSQVPKNREIVLTDIYGDEATKAAVLLRKNGYEKVSVLIEGINRLLLTDEMDLGCKKSIYISPVSYRLIPAKEFGRISSGSTMPVLLDVRSAEEFANKHKEGWRNIGHIKDAMNVPSTEFESRIGELKQFKDKEIVLYGFGSGPEVYATANTLWKNGFTKVSILTGGLFSLRWTAGNVKDQGYLKALVVDVPESNL